VLFLDSEYSWRGPDSSPRNIPQPIVLCRFDDVESAATGCSTWLTASRLFWTAVAVGFRKQALGVTVAYPMRVEGQPPSRQFRNPICPHESPPRRAATRPRPPSAGERARPAFWPSMIKAVRSAGAADPEPWPVWPCSAQSRLPLPPQNANRIHPRPAEQRTCTASRDR
jgi:hypothetical protein